MKRLLISALLSLASLTSFAQETENPNSCVSETQNFCESGKSFKENAQCLFQNFEKLSEPCQLEIKRFMRAIEQAKDQAQGVLVTPSALSSQSPPFTVISIESRYSPGNNEQKDNKVNFSTPLQQTAEEYIAASFAASALQFNQDVVLSSGLAVPNQLNRAEVGLQYTEKMPGFKNWGLRGSVGSASDQLFKESKDTTYSLIANYGYPTPTGGFWMWTVFFSNNSPLGNFIPIPGVMYMKRSPTFTGMFGFPMTSLQWTPSADRAYSLSLLGTSLSSEAAFGDVKEYQIYSVFKWNNQSYLLKDRKEEKDRLTYEEKKIGLGVRKFCFGNALVDLEGGYAFDRLVYLGEGLRNMRSGSADIDKNWYLALSMKAGF